MRISWMFLAAVLPLFFGAQGIELASGGSAGVVIAVPAAASAAESFAAEELAAYLGAISGAEFTIVRSDALPESPAIIVGRHPANRDLAAALDGAGDSYECFAIDVAGDRVRLSAPHSIGILYAGWQLLEDLGVAWLMPGRMGTHVPSDPAPALPEGRRYFSPGAEFRSSTNYTNAGEAWSLAHGGSELMVKELEHGVNAAYLYAWRQRLNSNIAFDSADAYAIMGAGHSYAQYLPIERYWNQHPEWFSLRDGRRRQPGELWQICATNPEAAAEFARNAMSEAANHLAAGIPQQRLLLFVSPNDYEEHCQCPSCLALVDPDGSVSSLILNFANLVAAAVHAEYPELKITYYIYHDYAKIPTKVRPADGVYAFLTAWSAANSIFANQAKPLMDPAWNPVFSADAAWFSANSDGVLAYPYYGHYEIFTPFPMMTQMNYDFKALAALPNFIGMNSESHLHWGSQPLNLYIFPKLLWNPQLDTGAAIAEFCRLAYGPAGEAAERLFAIQQRRMDQVSYICGTGVEVREILPPAVIAECADAARQIEALLPEMTPPVRWRTQVLLDGWHYSRLFAEAMQLMATGATAGDAAVVRDNLRAIADFITTDQGRYVFSAAVVRPMVNRYLPAVETNLQALPPGRSSWRDELAYGSTMKFYARTVGLVPGLWGYGLEAGDSGFAEWTLKTASGVFKELKVGFGLAHAGLTLSVKRGDRLETVTVHSGGGDTGWLTIPEEFLGTPEITLVVAGSNSGPSGAIWMCNARMEALIE